MSTARLVLVGASRYISPYTNNEVVLKGGSITVDEGVAIELLKEVRKDALNNEHPVWEEVEEGEELPVKASARVPRAVKAKAASKTAAKKDAGDEEDDGE